MSGSFRAVARRRPRLLLPAPLPPITKTRRMARPSASLPSPACGEGRTRGPQSREILARMVGRARQRRRRNHQEAFRIGDGLVGCKFLGRDKTRDRVMFWAWLQILSDGEEIDLRGAQIV